MSNLVFLMKMDCHICQTFMDCLPVFILPFAFLENTQIYSRKLVFFILSQAF